MMTVIFQVLFITFIVIRSILSNKPTNLQRGQVLDWFGGKNNFIKYHNIQKKNYSVDEFLIE